MKSILADTDLLEEVCLENEKDVERLRESKKSQSAGLVPAEAYVRIYGAWFGAVTFWRHRPKCLGRIVDENPFRAR